MVTHRRTARRFELLTIAFALFVPVQTVHAEPLLDSTELKVALDFRRTFGLTIDTTRVTSLEVDPTADRKYSVALSAEEVAEMDRRMEIQEAMTPLVEYARSQAHTFGGLHVDQAAGGVYHFAFTADVAKHQVALESLSPSGAQIVVRQVARTEAQIDALVDLVARDVDFGAEAAVTVHNVRSSAANNSVEVFIEPYSLDKALAFQDRYGPAVTVFPGEEPRLTACFTWDNCPGPPIMAGISNNWDCTVGFGIWMDGQRRFLTAGHCVYQVVSGWEWFHAGTSLGVSTDHSWFDMSAADAGSMGNVSSTIHSNRVLATTQPAWHGMTSVQQATGDYDGMAICKSAQTTGFDCGTILSRNATPNYDGTRMKWQRQAQYHVWDGDSGGAVISSSNMNMAVGLQSGRERCCDNIAYYSHIQYVLQPNGADGGIGAALWTYNSPSNTPHDFKSDGRADLIAIDDATGYLWIYPGNGVGGWGTRIGPNAGWASMNAIAGGANYAGTGHPDLIAIDDATGYLWIYPGNGAGGWGTRLGPDAGWASMNAIAGGANYAGTSSPDLIAIDDATGYLWIYPGNGAGGWGTRIGPDAGWASMNAIAGGADYNGDGLADLIAIDDTTGFLWIYPGDGAGGWGTRIGPDAGWGSMNAIT